MGSYVYSYTTNGNIKSVKTYEYTTGTLGAVLSTQNYSYDSYSEDLLISFNGNSVGYDYTGTKEHRFFLHK